VYSEQLDQQCHYYSANEKKREWTRYSNDKLNKANTAHTGDHYEKKIKMYVHCYCSQHAPTPMTSKVMIYK